MDIRCRKLDCKHNDKFTCRAKELYVDGEGDCSVYEKVKKQAPDTTKNLFSEIPEYSIQRDVKRLKIECKAPCILKREGRCIANGITVNEWNKKPVCMTILKK